MHIAGEQDELVKFSVQKLAMQAVRNRNGCDAQGTEWAPGCTLYASSKGAPLITFIHGGTHKYPAEAPALIARFFQEVASGKLLGGEAGK
jgi:polyhydroxybutyrate depolymerase